MHPAYAIAAAGAVGALYAWVAVAGWSRAAGDRGGAATAADDDDRPTRGAA